MSSILIIEDRMGFAKAIQRLLTQQSDLEIVAVIQSAEAVLKILRERNVDLVLVDVSLPPMNGIDIAQKILMEFPVLRCLMLSGHINQRYVKRSLEVGRVDTS